ncbi:MAG: 3-methyl-2-oxobutanoate dehydrogenase subunit VorB [Tenericutes bacterium GWC2_34_14]|nr:MAG: 3-methyl-2-oxobutanoate dehydrogenase subunit VorB [Tenericutes bacterium GWA2_35_7]OHE29206.1 MAG: 3-methyl-2-oxobutanoate dehydrogenase subunit VorB [Tenericutes bacterium GWC2_34_14]OHE34289.1 MAG: 3-methyl-2-oxobutanoate dehydrogenase subunit VorB [Tenericutes bacterium GWE2_34_108]OHE35641.1 MAG: 3-methyl-2-oxobutanoate dehydrogenase subunit VorB [Tenericutes bacterium GWF1_35_14]OHE38856.1 MAG: 3-methyl-2-oxobutanoate dehydrogenase subunit VorB [Tenericutes bacterium GWF2_35_184]
MSKVLIKGNEAIALAAVAAGCDAFFGYPITPQNEIPEYLSKYLTEKGRVFVQAESEVAAINMVYGAAGAGARVMTSSSSVGIALKQEGISYLAGAELPCVIVSVMRAGPGLGGIQPSQGDYFQATRGGGNGDYHTIVFAPESIQETVDLMKEAFDIADTYRNPVMILADGLIGQMMESVDMDKPIKKRDIKPKTYATIGTDFHEGRNIINSLGLDPVFQENHNKDLQAKYNLVKKNEIKVEVIDVEDADYVIVAYGTVARIARSAMEALKEKGIKVGMIRPISLWPYPRKAFDLVPKTCKGLLVTEMSMGQMLEDVLISNQGRFKVGFYGRAGGMVPEPEEIVDAILNFEDKVVEI